MGEFGRYQQLLKILFVTSIITMIAGSSLFYELALQGDIIAVTQPHPLPQISPAPDTPGEEVVYSEIDNMSIELGLTAFTFQSHSGEKGTGIRLEIKVENNGSCVIEDLCFWYMTIYWADGSGNFTTGFRPQENYTLGAESELSIVVSNSYVWIGIPDSLLMSTSKGYGRILMSYNSKETYILTTSLVSISHIIE